MAEITLTCSTCRAQVNIPIEADVNVFTCEHCGTESQIHDFDSLAGDLKDPLIGELVVDWEIREKVGEGGFGSVYKAWDRNLQRDVALKVMLQSLTSNLEYVQKFIREAITAAQLNHPNIVGIHRVGRDEERNLHFLVMEFLEGETLSDMIDRTGAMSLDEAINIIMQCSDALAVAQEKNIIHRDIKPENIMIDKAGTVKITDFGLAKTLTTDMKSTKVMGTPHYMSPEQFEGKPVDGRTDIYSLGVTFYHMLTEAKPYAGTNTVQIIYSILTQEPKPVTELKPDIPGEVWKIIRKMIAKDSNDRYANFRDVQRDLKGYLDGTLAETIQCPSCAARNLRGRKFCSKCGTSLVISCPKCGNEEPAGAGHCGECGANIAALMEVGKKMEEAARLRESGDLQRSLGVYQEVLEADPDHADAMEAAQFIRADLDRIEEKKAYVQGLLESGDADEALAALEELLTEFPRIDELKTYGKTVKKTLVQRVVDAQLMVAEKAMEEGNHEAAMRAYGQALDSDPDRPDLKERRDDLERRIKASDESLTGARAALERGKHADALNLAMEVLQFRPGHEEATHILEEAKKSVQSIETFVKEANELLDRREYDGAITRLESALRISPGDGNVASLLSVAKRRREALNEKVGLIRKLIEDENFEQAMAGADEILTEKEDHSTAIALKFHAEELLAALKKTERCRAMLGEASEAEQRGQLEEAQDICRKVLEIEPDHEGVAEVMSGLEEKITESGRLRSGADAHLAEGEFEQAVGVLNDLVELLPESEDAAARLAKARASLEQVDDTLIKGRGHLENKEYDEALACAEQVLGVAPKNIEAQGVKQEAERGKALIEKHLGEAENLVGSELFDDASQELTKALDLGAGGERVDQLQKIAQDGKVERLRSEATRSFVYEDYASAQEKYEEILELRGEDSEARKGVKVAEKAVRRSQREGVLSKVLVAGLLVLGLAFVQYRTIQGQGATVVTPPIAENGNGTGPGPNGDGPDPFIEDKFTKGLAELYADEGTLLDPDGPDRNGLTGLIGRYAELESGAAEAEEAVRKKLSDSVAFLEAVSEEFSAENDVRRLEILANAETLLQGTDPAEISRRSHYVARRRSLAENRIGASLESGFQAGADAEASGNWDAAESAYASLNPKSAADTKKRDEALQFIGAMKLVDGSETPQEKLKYLQDALGRVGTIDSAKRVRQPMVEEMLTAEVKGWRDRVAARESGETVVWGDLVREYDDILESPAVERVPGLLQEVENYREFASSMQAADVSYADANAKAGSPDPDEYVRALDKFLVAREAFDHAGETAPDQTRKSRAMTERLKVEEDWVGAVAAKVKAARDGGMTAEDFYKLVITPLANISGKLEMSPKEQKDLFEKVTEK